METAVAAKAGAEGLRPAASEGEGGAFVRKVLDVVRQADYRRIVPDGPGYEDVARLRYESFVRSGLMKADGSGAVRDAYDGLPNSYLFGVYLDGRLASTLRLHHVTRETPHGPALVVYPDILMPRLESGETWIDPCRFAADLDVAARVKVLPYVTLRLAVAACEHFAADYCLSMVREEHLGFYRRAFRSVRVGEPRHAPGIEVPVHLYHSKCEDNLPYATGRFPFFRTTDEERARLFASLS